MIPNIQPTRFESNVSSIQHAFTIEMTPTLAKLLSSQTYTDKILAAIREPLSNAYDSHVRAGTLDTPARLHLPTALEPHFSIRDFGTGLSHDDVIRLFFSYGVSDKRDTNNEIGGLGIGAKAFFAYTDQAVITSWHNGMKRTYSANKGTNGLPQGMLVSVEESDKPNGIELSYPVNLGDNYDFELRVVKILTFLNLKVESNKELDIRQPNILYTAELDGVKVEIPSDASIKKVVMGGIAYDVPRDVWVDRCHADLGSAHREGFLIHLPIGTVEISASRESLSPTEADKQLIVKTLGALREALQAEDWDSRIEKANTWIDAVKMRHQFGGFMRFDEYIVDGKRVSASEVMKWRGIRTQGSYELEDGRFPIWKVMRKSPRSKGYVASLFHSSNVAYQISAAYWMPTNKRVGWRDWYKDNVSLNWGSDEIHIHIHAETLAEAEQLAVEFGYDGPILDGTKCRVPSVQRRASNPRPTGVVWIVGQYGDSTKTELADFADPNAELIYIEGSKDGHPEAYVLRHFIDAGLIKTDKLSIIDRYNTPKDKAAKLYAGMAKSLKEWMAKHPELVDHNKLKACALGAEICRVWDTQNWCKFHMMRDYGSYVKFTMPKADYRFNSTTLEGYVPAPKITRHIDAIQKWHDVQLPKLPSLIQQLLKHNRYIQDRDVFELYNAMK